MADTPRYGYNAAGQWTILQPGEAEWNPNPTVALDKLYGNDNTSLLGQYYQAGGNFENTGGLLSASGASPKGTSVSDIVYDYTRPYTEEELARNLAGNQEWQSMYMNSPHWNPNDANAYAIQNQTYNPTRNTVSNPEKWDRWAIQNRYRKPPENTNVGSLSDGTKVINNSSTPVRVGGGLINNSVFPTTESVYKPETILQPATSETRQNPIMRLPETVTTSTTNTNTTTPYLSRVGESRMAYSGAPRYNDIVQTNNSQYNTGLNEATKTPNLDSPVRRGNTIDYTKALWR